MSAVEKLSRIFRTSPEVLKSLEEKMSVLTGQADVLSEIVK